MNFMDVRLPQRFWDKVIPEPNSGCWLWLAGKTKDGYGMATIAGVRVYAHRATFSAQDTIPDGLMIDHLCRVRCCVNPAHMECVTNRENVIRGAAPETNRVRQLSVTHCPKGHEKTPGNIYLRTTATGIKRKCRPCELAWAKARDAKRNNRRS